MYTNEVTIAYSEPRTTVITLETKDLMSDVELEDMAVEEFEENYPEAVDIEVIEVKNNVRQ